MRRILLWTAFVMLVLIDLSILPLALLLIFLGTAFDSAGHGAPFLPMSIFSLVVGAGLVWLTVIVGKALRPHGPPNA